MTRQAPETKPAMRKHNDAHPGIEIDNHGDPIPVEDRTADDRAAVHDASKARHPRRG